jgi:hypothetical protein
LDEEDPMALDVWSDEITIARPLRQVTAFAFDPANDPTWIGGIREARLEGQPPVRVGSRVRRVARFLGHRILYVMEVTELADGRMHMHAVRAPFPMDVTYEFKADDATGGGRTRARIRIQGETGGYYRLAGPLLPGMVRRSVTGDLRRLKRIVESDPPP